VLHDLAQVGMVVDLLAFGDLENDALDWKSEPLGSLERGADAQLRAIDGVRHEIDAEEARDTELAGDLDRLDAAGLVEAVAVGFIHVLKDLPGRLVLQAADQGLLGEDLVGCGVHDRLERHGEIKV